MTTSRWRQRDAQGVEAGKAFARCGPTRKVLAYASHLSQTRIHQIVHDGDPTGAPQHLTRLVDALARNPKTDPYPLIGLAHAIAEQAMAETRSPGGWGHEMLHGFVTETRAQAEEDVEQVTLTRSLTELAHHGFDPDALPRDERLLLKHRLRSWVSRAQDEVDSQQRLIGIGRVMLRGL